MSLHATMLQAKDHKRPSSAMGENEFCLDFTCQTSQARETPGHPQRALLKAVNKSWLDLHLAEIQPKPLRKS